MIALTPLLWREQRLLFLAWNPFVPVLALAWAIAAAADLASRAEPWRSPWGLVLLIVPLSLCVQAHAGLALPAALCAVAAGTGAWRHRTVLGERPGRTGVAVGAAVALLLWALPLVAEISGDPGNLRSMAAFLADPALPRAGWPRAVEAAAFMTLGPWLPAWVLEFAEVPAALPRWLPLALTALILAVAAQAAVDARRGDRFESAVATLAAVATLLAIVAARGIVGPMSDYLLLWATAAGALDAAVLLAAAARRVVPAPRAVAASWPAAARRRLHRGVGRRRRPSRRRQARRAGARSHAPGTRARSPGLLRSPRHRPARACLRAVGLAADGRARAAVREGGSSDRGR
jgi:hypothetical protein